MYMPFMLKLSHVVVFGGERGEGLQKTEKLALYADSVTVVPESACNLQSMVFPAGPIKHGSEKLSFLKETHVRVAQQSASRWNIGRFLRGADFVCSDLSSRKLNEQIARLCRKRGIRCNIIDTKDLCDTWFMSMIDTEGLLAAFSSHGNCAYASKTARESLLPAVETQGQISLILTKARNYLKQACPEQSALPILAAIHHDPQFQTLCTNQDWTAAETCALTMAQHRRDNHGQTI